MPNDFSSTPEGLLFIASGMDPVMKWDGLDPQLTTVGVRAPETALTLAGSGTGTITGAYTAYQRFVDADGNFSNLSPVSIEVTVASVLTITYTGVEIPQEAKIVSRQILRNTAGQADTYYVDVDTTDLGASTFSSTKTDALLSAETEVPIFNPDGSVNANRFGVPPNHKSLLAHHLGRMFAAGEVVYTRGCVQVTLGSTTVTGIGTEWTEEVDGRFLWVAGAPESYEIESVDVAAQTLTLTAVYQGSTDKFAGYGIRPPPAERRLLYYTEAGLPEAWPPTNALPLQEDGDEITDLYTNGAYLFFVERRHIYRMTFKDDPGLDGGIFLAAYRGCVNHRCTVIVEDIAYMLDEVGVHAFEGNESKPISQPIQRLFKGGDEIDLKINWRASSFFHATHYPQQNTIRWFVALGGDYLPRHALAFDFRREAWWIEEFRHKAGASAVMFLMGEPQVYLGSEGRRVFAFWQGTLDGPAEGAGDVRGSVGSATSTSITATGAIFPTAGVVNSPLWIVSGRGKGQCRQIVKVTGSILYVKEPWLIEPDATSTYQIGGIHWRYRTGEFRFIQDEQNNPRRVELLFTPTEEGAIMNMRIFLDRSDIPSEWTADFALDDGRGFSTYRNKPDAEMDLTKNNGFCQHRIDGCKDFYLDGPRFIQIELGGVQNSDPVEILGMAIDGATQ